MDTNSREKAQKAQEKRKKGAANREETKFYRKNAKDTKRRKDAPRRHGGVFRIRLPLTTP